MPQYPYQLDTSSKKYICPACGHKSTFVAYVSTETKKPIDECQYGRCDRENSCGYHQHPSVDPELAATKKETFVPIPEPVVVQIFPGENVYGSIINKTKTAISPLHSFCSKKLLIPNEHLLKWGVYSDKEDLTVYVYKNFKQQIVNLKWFKYKEDGHRDKNFNTYSLKQPKTPPAPPDQKNLTVEKYQMCLFGEHLLPRELDTVPVIIVESEKTAAIASFFYNQFHWLACGSNNGVTNGKNGKPDKISVLKGREVYWLSDADDASRMKTDDKGVVKPSSVLHLIEHIEKFHIVDLFSERNDGYDIGDAIADGLRPEIKPTWSKGKDVVEEKKKIESDDAYDYDLPDGVKFEDVKWDIRNYMHFVHKGKIFIVRKRKASDGEKGGNFFCTDITNFTIKSLGLIDSKTEPRRLVEMKNIHGLTKVLQVPTSAFASPNEFTVFIESEGNFQYDGVGTDLKKIRSRLYDTMLSFEEVDSLGWHRDGYFLFANGAYNGKFTPIDKYGFVKLGEKNFFIEPLSCITRENDEEWEDEKKFVYKERKEVKLKKWADLFCTVHKDNGRIALAWYITSLFRDFIYKRFKFFPHLFLFGPPGTGKSQVGWSIRAMGFSGLVKPFNLNTGTAVAFHREFAHFINFPAWCDEYDNSIPYERIQALKAAYDGVGHKKSVKDSDKRTKATQVNRAILISGQQLPIADNALFKRVLLLQFNQTDYTEQEVKNYSDLQTLEEGGLTHITAGFMHFRNLMEAEYMKEFEIVIKDMTTSAKGLGFEPEDRIVRNSAVILTTIKVLESKIPEMLPYTYQDLKTILMENMKGQMNLISSANETNTFWETVMFLSKLKIGQSLAIEQGTDFAFEYKKTIKVVVDRDEQLKEFSETTELLFIRFHKILPLYKEAFNKQKTTNAAAMDKGSLIHYLTHSKAFVGLISNYNFSDSRTSCYAFNYGILKDMGIYLGGSETNRGTPPPIVQPVGTAGTKQGEIKYSTVPEKKEDPDDMPF